MENPLLEDETSNYAAKQVSAPARKGGYRAISFIIATPACQMLTTVGISPNMILYLTKGYHLDIPTAGIILSLWSALSDYLVMLGAFVSDSYLGRFRVIALGSIFCVLGMALLCVTAMVPQAKPAPCSSSNLSCLSPTFPQLALILLALGCISIGSGSIRPCSTALGADQLVKKQSEKKNEAVVDRYFSWYYACVSFSSVVGYTFIVYIQDNFGMKIGYAIPAILMLLATSLFLGGSTLYVKKKPQKSLFVGLAQVLVASIKNRHLLLPPDDLDPMYYHLKDSEFIAPSEKLRFLNRACIIRNPQQDFNDDGSVVKPWQLCTVDQVEALKALISIMPIWSTGIVIYTTILQPSTVLQASIMDRHIISNFQIPAGSFGIFTSVSVTLWIVLYSNVIAPLLAKYAGLPRGLSPKVRMGTGLVMSCLSMGIAAIVERTRRRTAIQEGLLDDPNGVVSMSALWLIPQCCLSGVSEGINFVGQTEYYFAHLPKSMSTIAMALFSLGSAIAGTLGSIIIMTVNRVTKTGDKESWLSDNLNKGRFDYYFILLSSLSLLNFVYYLVCCGRDGQGPKAIAKARVLTGKRVLKSLSLKETLVMQYGDHLPA